MKIALIKPSLGDRYGKPYRTSIPLEPLIFALIAGHTPADVSLDFFDERMEEIDFSGVYDLVAISVETFTALRSYQIAHEFRKRGSKVMLGGFHPTLLPQEASQHCDSVAVGEIEGIWSHVIADLKNGTLKKQYCSQLDGLANFALDRRIFAQKKYLPLRLVETSRGCPFNCNFCAVRSFYGSRVTHKKTEEIAAEISALDSRWVFFADDNIVSDQDRARILFDAIAPLKISWASQASINSARNPEFLDAMAASGCRAVIIGLESLQSANLKNMNKSWVPKAEEIEMLLEEFRSRGIMVYGTFVFGYKADTPAVIRETVDFAISRKLFMANFNMLYPFPGTQIYDELKQQGRLIHEKWWLSRDFRWDFPAFIPESMSPEELAAAIQEARRRFNSLSSIICRAFDRKANMKNPLNALLYAAGNLSCRSDIRRKTGVRPGFSGKSVAGETECT